MTWALWGILGGLLCLLAIFFVTLSAFRFWPAWNPDQRTLAVTSWANQLFHGLVIMVIGVMSMRVDRWGMPLAGTCILLGALVLSGMLYAMIFKDRRVAPYVIIAGTTLLGLGWCAFIVTLASL